MDSRFRGNDVFFGAVDIKNDIAKAQNVIGKLSTSSAYFLHR
jgi:hypothetical protein